MYPLDVLWDFMLYDTRAPIVITVGIAASGLLAFLLVKFLETE